MATPIYILGGYQTDFAKSWARADQDISDMIRESTLGALEASGLDADAIQTIHVGNAFGELQRQQAHLGAMVSQVVPELWGRPAMRHEGACASSSLAVMAAMAELEAGRYDCALIVGAEEQKNVSGHEASRIQNSAAWNGREGFDCTYMWPAAFGRLAMEYEKRYGLDRQYLNRIAEINYGNARRNPLAQTRNWQFDALSFTDDNTANPLIEPGTRRQDCAQITDGACALVLVSERFVRDQGINASRLARISGWGHTTAPIRLQDKLEHSRGQTYVFPHLRQAIEDAWRRAGIRGTQDLGGIETHDCFTTTEYAAIDHFGLTPPGQSWQAIADGTIAPGGRCPINMSGGLIGGGHPVGATGARMLLDVARQVTGQAGACQIEGVQRMQTLNIGGSCATVATFVVENAAAA